MNPYKLINISINYVCLYYGSICLGLSSFLHSNLTMEEGCLFVLLRSPKPKVPGMFLILLESPWWWVGIHWGDFEMCKFAMLELLDLLLFSSRKDNKNEM